MDDCIFCKIAKGKIPNSKVYEDDNIMVVPDIRPASKGHVLVIPKEHYETFSIVPPELIKELAVIAQKAAKAVVAATESEGYNVLINNKRQAGQVVPHMHMHIIPRFSGDGIRLKWNHISYEEGEIEPLVDKLKKAMQ